MLLSFLKKSIFKENSTHRIFFGVMKGMKFNLTGDSHYSVLFGRWEPEITKEFLKHTKEGDCLLNLGANVGIHTLLFSKLVGKS